MFWGIICMILGLGNLLFLINFTIHDRIDWVFMIVTFITGLLLYGAMWELGKDISKTWMRTGFVPR